LRVKDVHKKILQGLFLWVLIFLTVSLGILIFQLKQGKLKIAGKEISLQKIVKLMQNLDKQDLLMVVLLMLFSILVLNPIKMYAILRAVGFNLDIRDVIQLYLSSIPIMNFAIGQRAASSAYLSYILYLYAGKSGKRATVYFLLENTINLIVMFLIIAWLTASFGIDPRARGIWSTLSKLFVIAFGLYVFAILFFELYLLRRKFKNQKIEYAKELYRLYKRALLRTLIDPKKALMIYGVAFLLYFTWYLELYFLLKAIGVELSLQTIAIAEAMVGTLLLVPTTPGDLGTLEAAEFYVYHELLGMSIEKLLVYYLLNRAVLFFTPSFVGLIMYYYVYSQKLKKALDQQLQE
jgi:uncharacterized protein (TIRG00374 family)